MQTPFIYCNSGMLRDTWVTASGPFLLKGEPLRGAHTEANNQRLKEWESFLSAGALQRIAPHVFRYFILDAPRDV